MEVVTKSYFLPLSQAQHWPEHQIGQLGHHLGKLVASQIKVAPGFLVPKDTLLKIARDNQLDHHLLSWMHIASNPATQAKAQKNLKHIFSNLRVSSEISSQYLKAFYQTIGEHQASIVASWVSPKYGHLSSQSQPAMGDATVWQIIMQTWAESLELILDPTAAFPNLEALVPAALLVQSHLKPTVTGYLLTQGTHKAIYELFVEIPSKLKKPAAVAQFSIDIRTWQLVRAILPSGVNQAQLRKYISDSQLLEIAQVAYRVKLHELHQLHIAWEIAAGQVFISNVERLPVLEERETTLLGTEGNLLLVGSPLVSGLATGPAQVMGRQPSEKQTFEQEIESPT